MNVKLPARYDLEVTRAAVATRHIPPRIELNCKLATARCATRYAGNPQQLQLRFLGNCSTGKPYEYTLKLLVNDIAQRPDSETNALDRTRLDFFGLFEHDIEHRPCESHLVHDVTPTQCPICPYARSAAESYPCGNDTSPSG